MKGEELSPISRGGENPEVIPGGSHTTGFLRLRRFRNRQPKEPALRQGHIKRFIFTYLTNLFSCERMAFLRCSPALSQCWQSLVQGAPARPNRTTSSASTNAYPPYSYVDKDGNAQGFDVDSMKWIAEKKGIEVTFMPVEWSGIIPALQAGKIDMVYAGMSITPERQEAVNFSNPYGPSTRTS